MSTLVERNKQLTRDIFAGKSRRTAFVCHPPQTSLIALRREFPTLNPCHCPGNWVPPELGPWVSNDEAGIMSTGMFEEFCLPELNDLSDTFGGLGMHCCADAEYQFPSFNKIRNWYGFNRVQAKRGYLPILDHFAGPGSPVHCLAWVSDEGMEQLMTRAPAGTRFIFVLAGAEGHAVPDWLERGRTVDSVREESVRLAGSMPVNLGGGNSH